MKTRLFKPLLVITALCSSLLLPLLTPASAQADFEQFNQPKVSITFDDGYTSTYEKALPILAEHQLNATAFITTGQVGEPGYMNWDQIRELQNTYNWEIGSHTVSHPELPTLSTDDIAFELKQSKADLLAQGLQVSSFASPYGAYDERVVAEAMRNYNLHRGFWDREQLNNYPYQKSVIHVQSLEEGVAVNQVKNWIDAAIAQNKWLVLVLHEVDTQLDPEYEYTTTTSDLKQIASYIKSKPISNVRMDHTMSLEGQNLLTNSNFAQGISQGWTTNNSAHVVHDTKNNGRFPDVQSTIKFTGSSAAAHLFSPNITANNSQYVVSANINAQGLTRGEIGIYIDEYNTQGKWISGQWKQYAPLGLNSELTLLYQPSTNNVAQFSVQTYLTAAASGAAYVDEYAVYAIGSTQPTPSPTPTPVPSPEPTPTPVPANPNLIGNPQFSDVDQGWASNWTRDNSTSVGIATVQQNNKLQLTNTGNTAAHAFSQKIALPQTDAAYIWSQQIQSQHTSGEFGFYIDEYDDNGNWISGQWLGLASYGSTGEISHIYKPTSSQVASINIQYYLMPNSDGQVFIDNVSLVLQ